MKLTKKSVLDITLAKAKKILTKLDTAYLNGESLVSDSVYDSIRTTIEDQWPQLKKKIGQRSDEDVKLPAPMASLNQYKLGTTKLEKGLAQGPFIVSDKLDGLSIEVVYSKGRPVAAYTRGDATHGKDVSHHIPSMRIPKQLPGKVDMVVRSEALMKTKTFLSKLHVSSGGRFKAARSAASGLIRNFETAPEFKHVRFVMFGIIKGDGANLTKSRQLAKLKTLGFDVVVHKKYKKLSQEDLPDILAERIAATKYELDGIVVTEDIAQPSAKATNPKHEFKFKMNSEADAVIVPIKSIVYAETKTGRLQPVAHFEPTMMDGGVTVSKANAHNGFYVEHGYLKDKKKPNQKKMPLGPGAVVKLIRSGKVIPYIMEVVKGATKPQLPIQPFKRSGVFFLAETKTTKGTARLLSSALRSLKVKSIGPSSVELLVENGITDLEQAFNAGKDVLESILGKARGATVHQSLIKLKAGTDLGTWMRAVAPYYMQGADSTFDRAVSEIPNLLKLAESGRTTTIKSKLQDIDNIKTIAAPMAVTIVSGVKLAAKIGVRLKKPKKIKVEGSKLSKLDVAFSGVRDAELKELIQRNGGQAGDSMKASTNVLIVKDPDSGSSKITKALDKGLPVMTIEQFKKKYKL